MIIPKQNQFCQRQVTETMAKYEAALREIAEQNGCEGWNHEQAILIARKALKNK